jgi:uncharacterized protein (TIGR03067 family)
MYRILSMACLGVVVATTAAAAGENAKELAKLDGTWVGVSTTLNGTVVDPDVCKKYADTIKGGKVVTRYQGNEVATATYTLVDTARTPAQIDLVIESGLLMGKMFKGIYKVEDGNMVTCFGLDGKVRPTAFESKKGSRTALQVMEKQTP